MRARSSGVSSTSTEPAFCSRYVRRLVPGIGTRSSPRASTHAIASCAGVTPFSAAISSTFAGKLEIRLEVLTREPWAATAEVVLVELVGRGEPTGQKPAPERGVRHEPDPKLAARRQDLGFGVAASTASTRSAPR